MILRPNFERVPEQALEQTLTRLLALEPRGLHSVVDCWNPDCPGCKQWKAWAADVRAVSQLIEMRDTNKKA